MKFLYVDESGGMNQGNIFVMCGLMVDAYKLRKKTEDVAKRLKVVYEQHPGERFELKTKKFLDGKGGWNKISNSDRQNLLSGLILDAIDGGSEIYGIGIAFDAFKNTMECNFGYPFGNSYWVSSAMFISSLVQKKMQTYTKNKGNTVFVVDDNKCETSNFSDALVECDPWYDGLYQQRRKKGGHLIWIPRKQNDRFDQIINTAFGIKSHNSSLIQVADAISYVYRRNLELCSENEAYDGERNYFKQLVTKMDEHRKTIGNVPEDSLSVEFYRKIRHPEWKL